MPEYSVLLVGCGEIAGGHDMHDHDRPPQTHAGAYAADPLFQLAACVEPNADKRHTFAAYWNIPLTFATLDAAFATDRFDVVSICSPSATHAATLTRTLAAKPRFVFAEKPLATSIETARDIVDSYESAGVRLGVNYMRRWDPSVKTVARQLTSGQWGKVRSAIGVYNKGVLHNGSHMIDLVSQLLGSVHVERALEAVVDHDPQDPVISALLRTETGIPVHLVAGDARDYPLFELTLIAEKGTIAFEGGGITIRSRQVGQNPLVPEHSFLSTGTFSTDGIRESMSATIANIGTTVSADAPFGCDARTALATETICAEMLARVKP